MHNYALFKTISLKYAKRKLKHSGTKKTQLKIAVFFISIYKNKF